MEPNGSGCNGSTVSERARKHSESAKSRSNNNHSSVSLRLVRQFGPKETAESCPNIAHSKSSTSKISVDQNKLRELLLNMEME